MLLVIKLNVCLHSNLLLQLGFLFPGGGGGGRGLSGWVYLKKFDFHFFFFVFSGLLHRTSDSTDAQEVTQLSFILESTVASDTHSQLALGVSRLIV